MLRKVLYRYTARKPCRLIHTDGNRYLERYYLGKVLGFTFYLHRFVAGDGDRALHDHPWQYSAALCLAGGYDEKRVCWFDPDKAFETTIKRVSPGCLNVIRAATFHQILTPKPDTWTLFAHSAKIKEWGFLTTRPSDASALAAGSPLQPYYFRDRDPESHKNWWEHVPLGKDCDRAPQPE